MNRCRPGPWFLALATLAVVTMSASGLPLPGYITGRNPGPKVRVASVEGIDERIWDGKLHLTLKAFLWLVLRNNTDVNLTRLDVVAAEDAVLSARAPFDPKLVFSFNTQRMESPQFSQIAGASTLNSLAQQSGATYQQTLPSGQVLNIGFNSLRSSSNDQFDYFNPSIATGLNISLAQSLLQNRNNIQLRAPLETVRAQLLIVSDQTEAKIGDLVASAARQYWDAIQARDTIAVEQLAVDLAQKSYERDQKALDLGALPKLDIYQSQSQVAERKVTLIQAQYAYKDALDGLRRLIGADIAPSTRDIEISLDDDPGFLPGDSAIGDASNAISDALARRPELKAISRRYSVDEWNERVARDSLRPRLDLGVQFGSNGLGGDQVPISGPLGTGPSNLIPGGLSDSLRQMFSFSAPFYGFSLQFILPVRNSAAQASLEDSALGKVRDQYAHRQLEQQIIQELKSTINQLNMARAQVGAAGQALGLAQKNVDAQEQKYELGGITAFELLDAQSRLANAKSALLGANVAYQKALISYKRANWTLLDGMQILVRPPKPF